ncbi:class I lanthipeptide [uncultured Dokdonia sp.]|uniref:class I lanthipeptide n=1 Tax=uncultured Dokdonia sp. TaxID=575653 RepID=UPI002618B180|nr:class I lanthipeptide [uncultured Dokdonia sp.]
MSKLNLKKKVVSVLTDEQQASIKGGGTTSYSNCTGFLCCNQKPCVVLTDGPAATCRMQDCSTLSGGDETIENVN